MNTAQLDKLVRFQRPDRALGYTGPLSDATYAALFGTDETTYRATVERIDAERTLAAERLAGDPEIRDRVARVPFTAGQRLVAIGESTTADRLSWFEILAALLTATRPDLALTFDNLAISGATTTQVLATAPGLARYRPGWLFCLLGTNDVRRLGSADGPRLVSEDETVRNLRALRTVARSDSAEWVWLTPPPVDEELVRRFPYFAGSAWTNADLAGIGDALRRGPDRVIDTAPAVRGDDTHLDDGLHPSAGTQRALAAHVLTALTD